VKKVFVDTGAWLAVTVQRDQYHQVAASYYLELIAGSSLFLTTNYVLLETYTRIRYDDDLPQAIALRQSLQQAQEARALQVVWITPEIEAEAWQIFSSYTDQSFSIVDCTSFVVARQEKVDEVFGFDKGFLTMGLLLQPGS